MRWYFTAGLSTMPSASSLWEVVPLPTGERFTEERLEQARKAVLEYLLGRGYFMAKVEMAVSRKERFRQVDTVFKIAPGPLATILSVDIEGVAKQEIAAIRKRIGLREGGTFDRGRFLRRLDNLKSYFLNRGYLAAVAEESESFDAESKTVAVTVKISNFGKVRVALEGFKIDKSELRRLLPILSGEGLNQEVLEEGAQNIREFLEEHGYPEAKVTISESSGKSDVRQVHYVVAAGQKVTVAFVDFKGNGAISRQELLSNVQVQPAHFFQRSIYSVARLDADVDSLKTLYQSRGYLDASVIPVISPVKEGATLGMAFEIEEGKLARTESVSITGARALSTTDLRSRIKLKPGSAYSQVLVEQDRQAILAAYNDAGFLQTRVTYRVGDRTATNSYPVEFEISEGTRTFVDHVVVLGNDLTRNSAVERRITFTRGEPLSLGKLLATQQKLYNMGVFDLVRVAPQNPESLYPYQDVVVRLQEAKRFTFRYGIGYQERDRLRGTLELSDLNIMGLARRADLTLRGSAIEQGAALSFQQPQFRFLPVDSYFTLSALQRRDVSFDQKRLNVSYQYGHPLSSHAWALLRYTFDNVRLSNLKVSPSELGREDSPRNLSSFSAIYINDTRDNYLDPERGFFTSTDVSLTTRLLGSNDYFSIYTQNSYFTKLPGALRMAASVRFGVLHPFAGDTSIPISERYFAGGGSSLRGFDTDFAGPLDPVTNQPVGGNALVIGNLEMRLPLLRSIHLAGFYDSGNVFRSLSDVSLGGFSHTVGAGLRLKTPFGPLRADYGFNLNLSQDLRSRGLTRGHIFVTIGSPF